MMVKDVKPRPKRCAQNMGRSDKLRGNMKIISRTNRTNNAKATEGTPAEKRAKSKIVTALVLVLLTAAINTTLAQNNGAWSKVKTVQEASAPSDAEDAAEEAKYLSELTEIMAKNNVAKPEQEAQLIIKWGKERALSEDDDIAASRFWDAAKLWLALGIPTQPIPDLMQLFPTYSSLRIRLSTLKTVILPAILKMNQPQQTL
jgi:hypothetical protein